MDFEFRVWCIGSRVRGLCFRVLGFGVRVRVRGFEFRVLALRFRVYEFGVWGMRFGV